MTTSKLGTYKKLQVLFCFGLMIYLFMFGFNSKPIAVQQTKNAGWKWLFINTFHSFYCHGYIFTQLRLLEGLNLAKLQADLGYDLLKEQHKAVDKLVQQGLAEITHNHLVLTPQGKLMADGIASELFLG